MISCAGCAISGAFGPEAQARSIEALPTVLLLVVVCVVVVSAITFLVGEPAEFGKNRTPRQSPNSAKCWISSRGCRIICDMQR